MEEQKEQEKTVFNLENNEDKEQLIKDSETGSGNFFKPESDITYKVVVTSPKVEKVIKEFDNDTVTKYQIQVKTQDKNGNIFEGIWEIGISVLNPIAKNYNPQQIYKITKTGTGKSTRYNVVVDF